MTYSEENFYKVAFMRSLDLLSVMAEFLSMLEFNPKNAPQVFNTPHFKSVQAALAEAQSTLKAVEALPDNMKLEGEEVKERSDGTPYVSKRVYTDTHWKITLWYAEDGHVTKRLSEQQN